MQDGGWSYLKNQQITFSQCDKILHGDAAYNPEPYLYQAGQ